MNNSPNIFSVRFSMLPIFLLAAQIATSQNVQLNFGQTAPTCFGYTNGTVTVIPSGGTEPYTVSWNNGQSGMTNYGVAAGTHSVTVTDQAGQIATGTTTVTQPAAVQPVISANGVSCNASGTLSVAATGGTGSTVFIWSNGSTGSTVPSGTGGNFFVTATDASGCQGVAAYTAAALLDVSIVVNNPPCGTLPNGGAAGAIVLGGISPFTYTWSNGSTDPAQQQLSAGTYTVTVRDFAGCSVVKSAVVTVPTPIDVQLVSVTPACGSALGSASISASGGTPPYRHVWSNGLVGTTATGLAPGQYYVCTFDVNNCQHDIFITIPAAGALNISLTPQNALCTGINNGSATVTVNPGTGNYNYVWSLPNAPNSNTISNLAPGTAVFVTVTEAATGCQGVANATIGTNTQIQISVNDTDIPCLGTGLGAASAIATGGTGSMTYTWTYPNNTTASGAQINNLTTGNYTVIARDSNGCTATGAAAIDVLSGVNLQVQNTNVGTCTTQATLTASADPGATLTWFDASGATVGTGTSILVPGGTAPATYRVVASNNSGCSDSKTVTVTPGSVTLDLSLSNTAQTCEGIPVNWGAFVTNASSAVNYQWSASNGLNITSGNTANPTLNGPAGTYQVTVTATTKEGCSATRTAPLTIAAKPAVTVNNPGISCNPQVTLNATATSGATLAWFNAAGTQISTNSMVSVPSGIYRVVATIAGGCSATETAEVKSNSADVSFSVTNQRQICEGTTSNWTVINNDANDILTFKWSVPANVTINQTNGTNPTLTAPTGIYSVSVTATNQHGCMSMLTAPLTVLAPPTLTITNANITACQAQVQLSATTTGNATITWKNAAGIAIGVGPSLTVSAGTAPAIYTAVVSNGLGCSDTKTITVTPNPTDVNLEVKNPTATCQGKNVNWSVTNKDPNDNLIYSWTAPAGVIFSPANSAPTAISTNVPGTYMITVTATNQHGCSAQFISPLTVEAVPEVTVVKNTIFACKDNTTLEATVTAGATLTWFDSNGNPVGTGNSATVPVAGNGIYSVVATNNQGCTDAETIQVTSNPTDISFGTNNPALNCENTTFNWSVVNNDPNDNLVYDWAGPTGVLFSPADGTNPIITGPVGNYNITVTATNQYGCSATLTAPVQVDQTGDLSGKVSADLCNGKVVNFTNTTNIAGVWTFGDGSTALGNDAVHTYAAAGNYVVKFTPNSPCITPFQKAIEVKNNPALAAAIGNNLQNCTNQASFQFNDLTVAQAGIQSWNWSFSQGNQTSTQQNPVVVFATEGAVTATLIVKDISGCADTATALVKSSIITESVNTSFDFCPGGSVALNADFNNNYTYQWTAEPSDPKLVSAAGNPTVAPLVPTTYKVTIKNGDCQIQYAALVTPKLATSVSLPADRTLCDNIATVIAATADAGAAITWSTSSLFQPVLSTETTFTVNPSGPSTTYYVRASKGNDCPGVDSIVVSRAPVRIEGVPVNRTVCLGDQTELTVTNLNSNTSLNYAWSSNLQPIANPKVVPPVGNTTYTVTATNAKGCSQVLSFQVKTLDVKAEARSDRDTICFGQVAQLNVTATGANTYTYNWDPAGTLTNGSIFNPIAQPESSITYTVTVTGDNVCQSTATVNIFFISNQCVEPYIFVPKAFTPNGDENNDYFIVRGVNIKDLYFVVWNRWGEKMFETEDVNSKGWDGSFNGTELTPDAYSWYVRVTCGNGAIYTKKGDVTLLK